MKSINILSLVQACNSLEQSSYTKFLEYYGIELKDQEIDDLKALINILCDITSNYKIYNEFYVGYKIPQIGKEFDLLRFGNESVINIELKRTSTEDKIKKQLIRNKYYLSYIDNKLYNLSFVSDIKQLYYLNDDEKLVKVKSSFLESLLRKQKIKNTKFIDDLFDPSDYLVSPFNSTKKFIEDKYFLTHQQEDIENKIEQTINLTNTVNFISVTGGAGTGKTLLIYDIVKTLRENKKKPLIIHCGNLNNGQSELIDHDWNIIPIKNYKRYDLSDYDAIFIDEVQRIRTGHLSDIIEKINISGGKCIFSYDKIQILSKAEECRDIDSKIKMINSLSVYNLSEKIRTNKEIATFIKMLFNKKRKLKLKNDGNIELSYFNDLEDAKDYLSSLDSSEWEVLQFTPSQYNKEHHEKYSKYSEKTSHGVLGQEFDGVVVIIDRHYTYNQFNELIYKGKTYYHATKMLFQNITRARKRVNLVIIDNEELLNRCVYILAN